MSSGDSPSLIHVRSGIVLASHVIVCRSWPCRLRGLLFRPALTENEALYLEPCNGVHTWGVRHAIAVVVLDKANRILHILPRVHPWSVVLPVRSGRITVELMADHPLVHVLQLGDVLELRR